MNDQDKEEFNEWLDEWSNECGNHNYVLELKEKVKKLQLENKKLRECITHYADLDDESIGYDIGVGYARHVLKELEKK